MSPSDEALTRMPEATDEEIEDELRKLTEKYRVSQHVAAIQADNAKLRERVEALEAVLRPLFVAAATIHTLTALKPARLNAARSELGKALTPAQAALSGWEPKDA